MESTPSTPFGRDEPVYNSRVWLLLAFIAACAWFVFTLYVKVPAALNSPEWGEDLLWLAGEVAVHLTVLLLLLHSTRTVWRSGERRIFDLMALAVNSQRPFLMAFSVVAGAGAIYFSIWAHEAHTMNIGLKQSLEAAKARPATHPQPAGQP